MNISQIKARTQETAPHYFTRSTMKFFNQTLKDFKVRKQPTGKYLIYAPMRNNEGKIIGQSVRYYNPITNNLDINQY